MFHLFSLFKLLLNCFPKIFLVFFSWINLEEKHLSMTPLNINVKYFIKFTRNILKIPLWNALTQLKSKNSILYIYIYSTLFISRIVENTNYPLWSTLVSLLLFPFEKLFQCLWDISIKLKFFFFIPPILKFYTFNWYYLFPNQSQLTKYR